LQKSLEHKDFQKEAIHSGQGNFVRRDSAADTKPLAAALSGAETVTGTPASPPCRISVKIGT